MNTASREPVTAELAARARSLRLADAPPEVAEVVRHCILDYLGVTVAGQRDPMLSPLRQELVEEGAAPRAQVYGDDLRLSPAGAALLNGTASHALDYDDVNFAIMGHPTVPILPAALALAEVRDVSGADLMEVFLAGYETENAIGLLVAPGHYALGFHATATIGVFGAAVACARLLGADDAQLRRALGVAATQAAGLKSMFGTACKPLHAGLAARNGLLAANLACRGFDSREDVLECVQGFAATHGPDFEPEKALARPPGGYHVLRNLFKYHASCYETHAAIEAARRLRTAYALEPAAIARVVITVNPYCDRICNIATPTTGLEAKFSLRQTVSFALAGLETADPALFDDASVRDPVVSVLRERTSVGFAADVGQGRARVAVETRDGRTHEAAYDAAQPMADLTAQRARLVAKFERLAAPVLGAARAREIVGIVDELTTLPSLRTLAAACARSGSAPK